MAQPLTYLNERTQAASTWIKEQYAKIKERLEKYFDGFNRFFRIPLSFVSSVVDAIRANLIINLPALLEAMNAIPFITGPLSILANLYNAVKTGLDEHTIIPTKIVKVIAALASIALTITMLSIPLIVLPLVIASTAVFFVSTLWDIGASICSRLFGEWKKDVKYLQELQTEGKADEFELKRAENRVLAHKTELHEHIHTLAIATISLAAAAMLLTPLAPVGAIILAIVAGYTVMDRLNVNPFRWLVNKIFGEPFKALEVEPAEKVEINSKQLYFNQQADLFKNLGVFEAKPIVTPENIPPVMEEKHNSDRDVCPGSGLSGQSLRL